MGFDNRLFKINGEGLETLKAVLKLAFKQEGDWIKAESWKITPEHGFVLCWYSNEYDKEMQNFPGKLSSDLAAQMVWEWLQQDETWEKNVYRDWEDDLDHDGDNYRGWVVYCEDWGHVADCHGAICAVKPCYLWAGK
jgi:hypothetical protein